MSLFIDKEGRIESTGGKTFVTINDFWAVRYEYTTENGRVCKYNYCNDYDMLKHYVLTIIRFYNEDLETDDFPGKDVDTDMIVETAPDIWESSDLHISIGPADNKDENFIAAVLNSKRAD